VKVIDVNLVNIAIIGLVMMLWRFATTLIAARWPGSKLATAFGLVAG
jgi:hypothetical protein